MAKSKHAHADALKAYITHLETLEPKRMVLIGKFYARDARYKTPITDVQGIQEIRAAFDRMFAHVGRVRYKVIHAAFAEDGFTALLRWDRLTEARGKRQVISGMSEVTFNQKSEIVSHIDYWDPAESYYRHMPVLGPLIRLAKKKLNG